MRTESGKGLENGYYTKRVLRIASVALAAVFAVVFSVTTVRDLEPERMIFAHGSVWLTASRAVFYSSLLLITAYALILVKKYKRKENDLPESFAYTAYYNTDPLFVKTVRITAGVTFLAEGVVTAVLLLTGKADVGVSAFPKVVAFIASFSLALYFLPEISEKLIPSGDKTHLIFGAVGLLWFYSNVIGDYFRKDIVVASPYLKLTEIVLILCGLAVMEEIRQKTERAEPKYTLFTLSLATFGCTGTAAGRLSALLCGKAVSPEDTALTVCLTVLSVYFITRTVFYSED